MKNRILYILTLNTSLLTGSIILFIFSDNVILRGFVSDIIAVIILYYFIKIVKNFKPLNLSILVFFISSSLEILQYFKITELLNLSNKFILLLLGNTFDPFDFIAYLTGVIISSYIDIKITENTIINNWNRFTFFKQKLIIK